MTEDIRKFYLNTLLKCYEFMRLSLNLIPEEIKPLVQIMGLAEDGYVYLEIWKGMDGLPQDGMLANNHLTKNWPPMDKSQPITLQASGGNKCAPFISPLG